MRAGFPPVHPPSRRRVARCNNAKSRSAMVGSPVLSTVCNALCARRKRGNNRVRRRSPEPRLMEDPPGQKGSWRPCFCLLRRLAGRGQPSVGCAVIGVADGGLTRWRRG